MTAATPSRQGQANGSGDVLALYLKVYGNEVMTAFETAQVFRDHQMVRSISSGKSAQFPIVGRNTAAYHTPGAEILGNSIAQNEKVIALDDILISPVFVADFDELLNHFDLSSIYSAECGKALAKAYDKTIAQVGVLAARASSPLSAASEPGGSAIAVGATPTGAQLAQGIFDAMQALTEKDADVSNVKGFFRPAEYYKMAATTSVINKDWNGEGSYARGEVIMVGGVPIVRTNHLPSTNITTGPSKYQGDFTGTLGLVMNDRAVGTVERMGISTRVDYDPRRLGTLMVSKMLVGTDVLRPANAVEIKKT